MKYKEWLNEWLNDYEKIYLKPRTYRNYDGVIHNHILPTLGEYELDELSLKVLQSFIIEREKNAQGRKAEGLAPGSIEIIMNVLQKSLDMAVDMGIIEYHYANRLKRPKNEVTKAECFSVTEQRIIESAIIKQLPNKKIGILISLYTGLRIGELMALRWSDIDFNNSTISVNHTTRDIYGNGRGETVLDTPKTVSSKRIIPIPYDLMRLIKMEQMVSECEYVIATKGGPTSTRSYQKLYENMLKTLNLKYRNFHTLRHTFATRALECGMDVKTLSEIMGHKSPIITLSRYSHSLTEHKRAMMNKLGENLGP